MVCGPALQGFALQQIVFAAGLPEGKMLFFQGIMDGPGGFRADPFNSLKLFHRGLQVCSDTAEVIG